MQSYYPPASRERKPLDHPAWFWKHKEFNYPYHPKGRELTNAFIEAEEKHLGAIEVLKFTLGHPEVSKNPQAIKESEIGIEVAKEVLDRARIELNRFNTQSPQERISLYEVEINQLNSQLEQAKAAEHEYTTQLLNDPDANKKRLQRLVSGYTGLEAEYDPAQLRNLRSLRTAVEEVTAKIRDCQNNILNISNQVAELDKRAEVKAAIKKVLPQFNQACEQMLKAWKELKTVADSQGTELSLNELGIPKEAIFSESTSPYQKTSVKILF